MAEVYSSLYKGDVHITTPFKDTHKAIDLGNYKTRNPIYSPNKLGNGKVSTIYTSYTYKGILYKNSLVLWVHYDNGYKTAMYHGQASDKIVNVGDRVVVGQQIYRTGNTGYSFGDHLHFELWKDGVKVDPTKLVINDKMTIYKIGQRLEFLDKMNIRDSANGKIVGAVSKGAVGEIVKVSTFTNGYQWYQVKFGDLTGYVADTNLNKVTTKNITNISGTIPQPPQQTECEKEVERLQTEIIRLTGELGASQGDKKVLSERVEFLENTMAIRDKEYNDLKSDYDRILEERNMYEKQYQEVVTELNELKEGRDSILKRLGDIIYKLFKGEDR